MEDPGQRKTEELRSWLFLTAVMAPVLAVLIVSGYGFVVWMLQLI
jgi:nitrate reductase NapE